MSSLCNSVTHDFQQNKGNINRNVASWVRGLIIPTYRALNCPYTSGWCAQLQRPADVTVSINRKVVRCEGLGTHMAFRCISSDCFGEISIEGNGFLSPKAGTFLLVVIFHCGYVKLRVWADACYKTKDPTWPHLNTNSPAFLNQKTHWIPLTFKKFFCKRCPWSAPKPWRRMGSREGKGTRGWFLSAYLGLAPGRGAGPWPLENIPAGALTFWFPLHSSSSHSPSPLLPPWSGASVPCAYPGDQNARPVQFILGSQTLRPQTFSSTPFLLPLRCGEKDKLYVARLVEEDTVWNC